MRGLAMAEALGIIEGKDEEQRNEVETLEKGIRHYNRDIVAEFSDENKRPNP
jgi:hypothetical protein